jgi:exopolysaccharide production protein ExoZ
VLRAVAALMVVAHHATIMLGVRNGLIVGNWLVGASGVDIFFIISGFVMTISSEPLLRVRHPARIFLARRLERIAPLYWLMTTLKIALVLAAPAMAINELGGWRHVVDSYLFVPGLFEHPAGDPVVVVGWTLNFEMAFYALFALALAARVSLLKVVTPVLIVVALLAPVLSVHRVPVLAFYCNPIVLEFLFGMLLARAVRLWGTPPVWISLVLVLAGFVVLVNTPMAIVSLWRWSIWGLPAVAIVTGTLGLERKFGRAAPRWLLAMGDASYSIYLAHTFVLPLIGAGLMRFGQQWPGVIPVSIALSVGLSMVAGWILYRLVELPIMRYFKGRRRTAIPAVAVAG